MNSTPNPNATDPNDVLIARADERLAHAYEQIARADEQLARVTEQISRLEQDDAPRISVRPDHPPSGDRAVLRGLGGLLLAACIFGAAFVWQSSYHDAAKLMIARWVPQIALASSLLPENSKPLAQPYSSAVQLAAAEPDPAQTTPLAQTAQHDVAPPTNKVSVDQLLQTIARDLANVEQEIQQLKAGQQQMASDNARAVEQIKASQDQMAQLIARVSEQNARPKPLTPQLQPIAATTRKPVPTPPGVQR
jgi:hypothetical protein